MRIIVFFGGTLETGVAQLGRFVRSVPADHYVLVRGLGASTMTDAELLKASGYNAASERLRSNDLTEGQIALEKLHLIEQAYEGNAVTGFRKKDLEQITNNVSKHLNDLLKKRTGDEKVQFVFAGWSRGAAVALASFAGALAWNNAISNDILNHRGIYSAAFMFIDPVAGQTGNEYPDWMPKDWDAGRLYSYLTNMCNYHRIHWSPRIYEFWSIAGALEGTPLSANPARRFMCSYPKNVELKRFAIGERHGSGVDATDGNDEDFNSISKLMIAWLDHHLDLKNDESGVALAEDLLEQRSLEQRKQFNAGKRNRLRSEYDDISGKKFPFASLWTSGE